MPLGRSRERVVYGLQRARTAIHRPSGAYFALLGHDTFNGVEFAHPAKCTDCGACEKACPVDLLPRRMSGGAYRAGVGLYPDGASNFALCLRCGDCVAACEATTARNGAPAPLRMGFLPPHARQSSPCTTGAPVDPR